MSSELHYAWSRESAARACMRSPMLCDPILRIETLLSSMTSGYYPCQLEPQNRADSWEVLCAVPLAWKFAAWPGKLARRCTFPVAPLLSRISAYLSDGICYCLGLIQKYHIATLTSMALTWPHSQSLLRMSVIASRLRCHFPDSRRSRSLMRRIEPAT